MALLIGLSLALLIGYFAVNRDRPWLWLPVGMLLGGALGNLADRAREGAVIDFIDPIALAGVQRGRLLHRDGRAGCCCGWWRGGHSGAVRLEATAEDAGLRLDAFLAARGAAPSRSAAQRLIDAGAVLVDGARGRRTTAWPRARRWRSTPGRRRRAAHEPDAGVRGRLRGRRPAGGRQAGRARDPSRLRATAARRSAEALRGRAAGGPDPERAGIVHRLDRDTSGLLVVTKTEEAHAALLEAAARARGAARVPRPGGGPPRGRERHDRRPDRAATARAAPWSPRAATGRARRSRTSR